MCSLRVFLLNFIIFLACCVSTGCGKSPIMYSEQPAPADIAESNIASSNVRVLANAGEWRNSGVIVRKGVNYTISANGQWRLWSHYPWTTADGMTANIGYGVSFVSDFPTDALVGKIGATGRPFGIGKLRTVTANDSGVLYLKINDNAAPFFIGSREGYVDAEVKLTNPGQRLKTIQVSSNGMGEAAYQNQVILPQVETPSQMKVAQVPTKIQKVNMRERRLALVIGNSTYRVSPLKNPANDAQDIAAALRKVGFDVTLVRDATQQQMENAVREFGLKLRQGGTGLFYYAGHGVQVAGENYLVPVNAVIQTEGDVKFGCLPAGLVLAKMEDAGNDVNIVILDACRNNAFSRNFRSADQGLAKMDAPTGSLISYATAPGSVASDGAGRNGLFTQHLLRNIATPGLPITEVFMRVRQGVVQETKKKQVPWESSSLIGQFYFSE